MTFQSMLKSASVCLAALVVLVGAGPSYADFVEAWQVGLDDNVAVGASGTAFVQESQNSNPAPGSAISMNQNGTADDDYYLAGTYPAPIGTLATDEIAMERAFVPNDPRLRIHFNLPADLNPLDSFRFTTEPQSLDQRAEISDPRYDMEVAFNGVVIMPNATYGPADLTMHFTSDVFTAASVNAVGGPGGDNIIELRGQNLPNGGDWMGFDFHRLETEAVIVPEPSTLVLISLGGILLLPLLKRRRMADQA